MKFKVRTKENPKKSKIAERHASVDIDDGFIASAVSDEVTKIEEIPRQFGINSEVGQSDKSLLQTKSGIETLMYTNTEPVSSNSRARPTKTQNRDLNCTSKQTSSK